MSACWLFCCFWNIFTTIKDMQFLTEIHAPNMMNCNIYYILFYFGGLKELVFVLDQWLAYCKPRGTWTFLTWRIRMEINLRLVLSLTSFRYEGHRVLTVSNKTKLKNMFFRFNSELWNSGVLLHPVPFAADDPKRPQQHVWDGAVSAENSGHQLDCDSPTWS